MVIILKFILEIKSEQTIRIPVKHEFLSCQTKGKKPTLWAKAWIDNPPYKIEDQPMTEVKILTHGTNYRIVNLDDTDFLGTVQIGALVLHIFKQKNS